MKVILFFIAFAFVSCQEATISAGAKPQIERTKNEATNQIKNYDTTTKTIHVFVALCDNQYQGIVPVPQHLGDGQQPNTNLYWGAAFGIKSFFKKSKEWKLVETRSIDSVKIERLIFQHTNKKFFLVADAYNGKYIKQTTLDFLKSSCGQEKDTVQLQSKTIGTAGHAVLCAYIGHNGLMDFELSATFKNTDRIRRDLIILACYSQRFFSPHLQNAFVQPLVWTTGFMAPEAYTLHDALQAYIGQQNKDSIRIQAAAAYAKYQKCSLAAAKRLLVSGW